MTYEAITIPIGVDTNKVGNVSTWGQTVAPGLAVTPHLAQGDDGQPYYTGGWTLTHISSGFRVNPGDTFRCIGCIREFADAAIGTGLDWTSPMGNIVPHLNAGGSAHEAMRSACKELATCAGTQCSYQLSVPFTIGEA